MKIHLCSTLFFGITLFAFNCQKNQKLSADEIIAKSIENINAPLLNQAEVRFKFREQEVSYRNYNGTFHHQRTFQDTSGNMIHDELTNSSFTRSVNGEELNLSEEEQTNLSGGLNSIIYFAFLPYRLQDPSVNAELMGKVSIKGKDYHKIKVTFDQEGGGEDFEDIFLYYFEFSDYSLDYLAYAYHVHGGGIRFRVAQPISEETEVKMQNYVNYKPKGDIDFLNIEEAYENDQLMELSKIELYDIEIKKIELKHTRPIKQNMDKILITSIGTRGDIEPFLNLAIQFEAKGYQIVCLFPENFRSLVKQYNFEFYSYGKQFLDLIESPEGKNLMSSGGALKKIWSYFKLHSTFKNINQTFVAKQYETIQEINPDLIIYNGKVLLPFLLHVRTKIKSILVSPVPYLYHPTTSRAHIAFRLNFGSWFNLKTYQLADRGLLRSYLQVKNIFNETKSLTKDELKYAVRDRIVFYTISRRLFDKPSDWSENAIIGGYPFLSCKSEYSPDRNLEKFIARHGKILLVSFGSMVNSNPKKNTNILLSVMEELKIPAIINTADGGLTVPKAYNSDLFYFCSYIPYDWILPQVYAVLHHGGSGTTHMACFYGCPSLIIPHIIDQFMWNELIFEKGLGPKGPSINKMNKGVLLERIEDLYSNFTYKSNALFMAHKMHNEQFTFGDVSSQIMEHLRQTVPSLNKEQTSA